MRAVGVAALFNGVTICQHSWQTGFVTGNFNRKTGQYIRPVQIIGDAAETLGFTLRAIHAVRQI